MSSPGTIQLPEIDDGLTSGHGGWIVTVYDNEKNTWEEVMTILMIATECSPEEAYNETWEVHHLGASVVHFGGEKECLAVARIIATIGIKVRASEGT